MRQRAIRPSDATFRQSREVPKQEGFGSPTAFIRNAVEQRLMDRQALPPFVVRCRWPNLSFATCRDSAPPGPLRDLCR